MHGIGMHSMREAEVGSRWPWRGRPLDSLLDVAVMTLGTVRRLRPHRSIREGHAGMATGARRKELTVLPVVEPITCLGKALLKQQWLCQHESDQEARPDHVPARRRPRCARGSGT